MCSSDLKNNLRYRDLNLPSVRFGSLYFTNRFEGDTQWLSPEDVQMLSNMGWTSYYSIAKEDWTAYPGNKLIITLTTKKSYGEKIWFKFNDNSFTIVEGATFLYNSTTDNKVYKISDQTIKIRGNDVKFFQMQRTKNRKIGCESKWRP